ncbi:oxidoreductase [Paractinoplanes toevensis]|uniref:Oxidoreductase n=1 Tax=Paractinoplanes toevensis TaxID=571911 RepID=A0A919TCD1_9ACTN|nr:oxidoreductase [Actinoplanes toevensis]GIM93008.1 oxidoreductase [Actinoplanes toevensis]
METFTIARHVVDRVGFGAMQLAGPGVFGPPADRDIALEVLRRAVEGGVNHIDTADYYGPRVVNELIRDALYPYPEDLVLVSKVGARRTPSGGVVAWDDPRALRQGIEDNLTVLGVDRLAAVNLRVMGGRGADARFADQVEVMAQARDDGLIDGVGLSNVSPEQLLLALTITEVVCVQNSFGLLERGSDAVLRLCADRGIAFVPFTPLGFPASQRQSIVAHPDVRDVSRLLGISPVQVALAWVAGAAPNVLLIPGTSSLGHLAENLAVRDITLDDASVERLNRAFGVSPS